MQRAITDTFAGVPVSDLDAGILVHAVLRATPGHAYQSPSLMTMISTNSAKTPKMAATIVTFSR